MKTSEFKRSLPKYQIMILVPYESFKIKTSLPLDDVLLKIANHVETKKTYWTVDISKSFQGSLKKRVLDYIVERYLGFLLV